LPQEPAVAQTVPTTMAGLLAVLRYVREQSNDELPFFDDGEETICFIASLEQAVSGLLNNY
jgi:hypothetical protein